MMIHVPDDTPIKHIVALSKAINCDFHQTTAYEVELVRPEITSNVLEFSRPALCRLAPVVA